MVGVSPSAATTANTRSDASQVSFLLLRPGRSSVSVSYASACFRCFWSSNFSCFDFGCCCCCCCLTRAPHGVHVLTRSIRRSSPRAGGGCRSCCGSRGCAGCNGGSGGGRDGAGGAGGRRGVFAVVEGVAGVVLLTGANRRSRCEVRDDVARVAGCCWLLVGELGGGVCVSRG